MLASYTCLERLGGELASSGDLFLVEPSTQEKILQNRQRWGHINAIFVQICPPHGCTTDLSIRRRSVACGFVHARVAGSSVVYIVGFAPAIDYRSIVRSACAGQPVCESWKHKCTHTRYISLGSRQVRKNAVGLGARCVRIYIYTYTEPLHRRICT